MKKKYLLGIVIARAVAVAIVRLCDRHIGKEKYSLLVEITPNYKKGESNEADAE